MAKHLRIPAILLFCLSSVFGQLPEGIVDTQQGESEPPTPKESLEKITVPPGFNVTLFAGEPNVAQPIAINYDDRGRLWVAESFSYIEWKRKGRDRILIFEDTDNDGQFDKRSVFWDKGNHVSGFQIGAGGVWVCDAPNLLFIPDKNRDDIPDAGPRVVLDGWTTKAEHNFFNGLTWGPDGWLYGRHGIKHPSKVGKPGDSKEDRKVVSCSIWRYHPTKEIFEVYAEGTINPWGLDWNGEGQAFITTSVIDHFWHLVPGARFATWEGRSAANHPYSYSLMEPTSVHRHWKGGQTERTKEGLHDEEGGGHSHCGLMIYQSDRWPAGYQGRAFFSNVLGQRINMEHLDRRNSGYVASHGDDFLKGGSDWFRATDLKQGPYGEMMIAEWTDFGECHDRDGIHRTSGRIYRINYGENPAPKVFDIGQMSTKQLIELLTHENVWWRRQALRNLYVKSWNGQSITDTQKTKLMELAKSGTIRDSISAIQALNAFAEDSAWIHSLYLANSAAERDTVRAQLIGLAFSQGEPPTQEQSKWLSEIIPKEPSPLVQLWIAGVMQRIPLESRREAAERLTGIEISPTDRNLRLMRWYSFEPLVDEDPGRAAEIALESKDPFLSESIARRIVSANALDTLLNELTQFTGSTAIEPILEGILSELPGKVEMPNSWSELFPKLKSHESDHIQKMAFQLAQRFGDRAAEKEMLSIVINPDSTPDTRIEMIRLLVASRSDALAEHLKSLLTDPEIGTEAIRAVSVYPKQVSAADLIQLFNTDSISDESKTAILETLASRPDFADSLVASFLDGQISKDQIPAYLARQISGVSKQGATFAKKWGLNPGETKQKEKLISLWKKRLPESALATANPIEGRHVFQRVCGTCHKMYGEGGVLGPDLTGSNRANLDYFLINVLFPGEDVSDDYKLVTLTLNDGRILTGNIVEESDQVLTFRQVGQLQRVDKSEIASRSVANVSLMPPGLLDTLKREDVRDLISYLRTTEAPTQ